MGCKCGWILGPDHTADSRVDCPNNLHPLHRGSTKCNFDGIGGNDAIFYNLDGVVLWQWYSNLICLHGVVYHELRVRMYTLHLQVRTKIQYP